MILLCATYLFINNLLLSEVTALERNNITRVLIKANLSNFATIDQRWTDDKELPRTVQLTEDRVLLHMEAPENFRGPLNYTVKVKCLDFWCKNETSIVQVSLNNYSKTLTKKLSNLYFNSSYQVSVVAKRLNQTDIERTYPVVKTPTSKPDPVRNATIYAVEGKRMWIKWLDSDYTPKEKYNVRLQKNEFIIAATNEAAPCDLWENYTCANLTIPGDLQTYNISIKTKNYNVIEWSETETICGAIQNETTPPQNLTAIFNSSFKSFFIKWDHPLYTYGKIYRFYIKINNDTFTKNISTYQRTYKEWVETDYQQKNTISIWSNNSNKSSLILDLLSSTAEINYNTTILNEAQNSTTSQPDEVTVPSSKKVTTNTISVWDSNKKPPTIVSDASFNTEYNNLSNSEPKNPSLDLDSKRSTAIIVSVIVVSLLVITLVILILARVRKHRNNRKTSKNGETTELLSVGGRHSFVEIGNEKLTNISKSIHIANLQRYITSCLENENDNDIIKQFKGLPKAKTTVCRVGLLIKNLQKNRYPNIIPCNFLLKISASFNESSKFGKLVIRDDKNRVVLKNQKDSDYINASYIDGYKTLKAYIATQAPLASTIPDFWKMVWQEKAEVVIMLTEPGENTKIKFEKYWPEPDTKCKYGQFLIECTATSYEACYVHRQLMVKFGDKERTVHHYNYLEWPEDGIPSNTKEFAYLLQEVATFPEKAPTVVHCSDGCGRTGSFILCNIIIKMALEERHVDFPKVLDQIRDQRCYLVANTEQYFFCYRVVEEYVYGKKFSIPIFNNCEYKIKKALHELYLKLLLVRLEIAQQQYTNVDIVLSSEDKLKNRFLNILPGQSQIFLPTSRNTSNYINAITVDSFQAPGKIIVSQQPLPETIGDFWEMIDTYEINVIISLNEITKSDPRCPKFWPSDRKPWRDFERSLEIQFLKDVKYSRYKIVEVKVENSQKCHRIVQIVQLTDWKRNTLHPSNPSDLINIFKNYMTCNGKIVVTCYDGATASGLFVALTHVLEEIDNKRICDVFSAVRNIREYRPQFVQDIEQLKFLYKAVLEYIKEFENKNNSNVDVKYSNL